MENQSCQIENGLQKSLEYILGNQEKDTYKDLLGNLKFLSRGYLPEFGS